MDPFQNPKKKMTMEDIDKMLSIQLQLMQKDYEQCTEYENKIKNQNEEIILRGKFEKSELEDGTKFKDDIDQVKEAEDKNLSDITNTLNEMNNDGINSNNNNNYQNISESKNEYQPIDCNDQNLFEDENDEYDDFQQAPQKEQQTNEQLRVENKRKQEEFYSQQQKKDYDFKKIKEIMNSFTLKAPEWANDYDQWRSRLGSIIKENSVI